jgi:hypothetical protein
VLSATGHGRGYVTVELRPDDGGDSLTTTTEDSGNFLFDEVPPGQYTLYVLMSNETELPSDNPTVRLSPGRTLTINVMLAPTKD